MNIKHFLISWFLIITHSATAFFGKIPFRQRIRIKDKEVHRKIEYSIPYEKQKIVDKIRGTYSIVGPDIHINNVSSIIDLFMGDGNIQSVFFNKGELTFDKHYVRTEKILYEEKYGKLPDHVLIKVFLDYLYRLKLFPNIMGVANTALVNIKNRVYALYERDMPYLLNIDWVKQTFQTIRKRNISCMKTFSAHAKFNQTIETIDYNIITGSVDYHELTEDFVPIHSKRLKMKYMPIVHDFGKTDHHIFIVDSPLVFDFANVFRNPLPVILNPQLPTLVHVVDKTMGTIEQYCTKEGVYIFHFAECIETEQTFELYAAMYDKLDFSTLNISGKYRKMVLDKTTKEAQIIKNDYLEGLDIEFPVRYGDRVVFRKMVDKRIVGFIVCKGLDVIQELNYTNRFLSGEPAITYIENVPYLISFAFDDNDPAIHNRGFVMIVNMDTYETIEIPLNETLNIGFHSIFLQNLTPSSDIL